jgi:dTDP-glucose 4,6-dehydratase
MRLLVTGGAGFIGSNFIKYVLDNQDTQVEAVLNLDALSYAGKEKNCEQFRKNPKYKFRQGDITYLNQMMDVFHRYKPTHVIHFAAETHVDNSIKKPSKFIDTTCYDPRNPYSASKAASDHVVRAAYHTFGLPITISNCSNNYGPNQHREKFIPTILTSLKNDKKIPVYGQGSNVRDWIYVDDHCEAVWKIVVEGTVGETYNIGSNCEKSNLEIIEEICKSLNLEPSSCIEFVEDRKGHDFRYAIDAKKIRRELKWKPKHNLRRGLKKTIVSYA